ncbi:hypothetical protein LguiA_002562 [Lonicera macranthoides]
MIHRLSCKRKDQLFVREGCKEIGSVRRRCLGYLTSNPAKEVNAVVYPCISGQPWFTLNERKRFGGTGGLKSESKETQTLFLIIGGALVPHCPSLSTLKDFPPLGHHLNASPSPSKSTTSVPNSLVALHSHKNRISQKIVNPQTVDVDGELYTVKNILISVGGWPSIPEFPGSEYVIDSNVALELPSKPKKIAIVGGGVHCT